MHSCCLVLQTPGFPILVTQLAPPSRCEVKLLVLGSFPKLPRTLVLNHLADIVHALSLKIVPHASLLSQLLYAVSYVLHGHHDCEKVSSLLLNHFM